MGMSTRGLGRAEGAVLVTNEEISRDLDTTPEWIKTRTGILSRRFAAEKETTSTMGAAAAARALAHAAVRDVDLTICCTMTPDYQSMPSTAALIQGELGLSGGAMDLNVACSGWVYGLVVVNGLLQSRAVKRVLLVGADKTSCLTDPRDRSTRVLFGDGAGAAVLEYVEAPGEFVASDLGNDPSLSHLLFVPAGGSACPIGPEELANRSNYLQMAGREVFRAAVRVVVETCKAVLAKAGLSVSDVDFFIPHQANVRIVSYAAEKLGFSPEKVITNVDRYGNTSAASIPIALTEAWEDGRVKAGDRLLFCGFGAGMSWGSVLMEWSLEK